MIISNVSSVWRLHSLKVPCTDCPTLTYHTIESAYGMDNHFTSLVRVILKKYMACRIKKALKDQHNEKKSKGNSIHRSRIFQNV